MSEKCNKYESLFIFSDEKTLAEHILTCEECRFQHEKMKKVSALINEVKPKFKKHIFTKLKIACVFFILMIGGISFNIAQQYGMLDTVLYGEQLSMSDLGIPTDSYGLIKVDE